MRLRTIALVAGFAAAAVAAACATGGRFAGPQPADPCAAARQGVPPFDGANRVDGRQLYDTQCARCHSLSDSGPHLPGPHLEEILGRRVGGLDSFRYSTAFRGRKDVWTLDALDRYIEDPEWFVPGTRMIYDGMPDGEDRRDVIAYFACATR